MSAWKYTDASCSVASRVNIDGSVESVLVEHLPAGVSVEDPDPAPLPTVVTPWQIRKALNASGLRGLIEASVAGADQTTKDAWEYALEFRRDNPLITGLAVALGKTEAELDDLFALAASL